MRAAQATAIEQLKGEIGADLATFTRQMLTSHAGPRSDKDILDRWLATSGMKYAKLGVVSYEWLITRVRRQRRRIEKSGIEPKRSRPSGSSEASKPTRAPESRKIVVVRPLPYGVAELPEDNVDLFQKSPRMLRKLVVAVVKRESPVHVRVVLRRIAHVHGLQRVGSRIQRHVERAFTGSPEVKLVGEFLYYVGKPIIVRSRKELGFEKNIEYIAPEEIAMAVLAARRTRGVRTNWDAIKRASELLGFDMLSEKTRAGIAAAMELLDKRLLNTAELESYLQEQARIP